MGFGEMSPRFGIRVSIVFVNKNDSLNWKIYQKKKNSFVLTTISTPLRVSSGGGLLLNQDGLKLFTPKVRCGNRKVLGGSGTGGACISLMELH